MDEVIKASSEVLLVSIEDQSELTLIDPKTRGVLETYSDDAGSSNWIARNTLSIAPKIGQILGFQNQKTILNIWNTTSKKVSLRVSCSEKLTSTAVSHSELLFAAGSASGFIYVWETLSGELLRKHKAHQSQIRCIQFSSDDGLLITAADDALSHVFLMSSLLAPAVQMKLDLNNGKSDIRPKHTLIGHSEKINAITQSKGVLGKLYTASSDKTVIVWDLCKGSKLGQFSVESEINCLELDGDEEYLVIGCKNGNLYKLKINDNISYKLDLDELTETPTLERSRLGRNAVFKGHTAEVTHVKLYEEVRQFISGGKDGLIIFWDFEGQIVKTLSLFQRSITNMSIFRRPKEFEQHNSLIVSKRSLSFKPFHRYEEGDASFNNINNSNNIKSDKDHQFIMVDGIKKKINKNKLTKKSFVNSTRFLLKSNAIEEEKGDQTEQTTITLSQEQIKELLAENAKLKQINHSLFNKNIAPSTS